MIKSVIQEDEGSVDNVSVQEIQIENKVYKEKPYFNSDRDPFGLTINGKT